MLMEVGVCFVTPRHLCPSACDTLGLGLHVRQFDGVGSLDDPTDSLRVLAGTPMCSRK